MSLRSVLLALLSKQANTGYGVGRLLHGELSYLWEASLQQIYCELGRLEREGLVEVESIAMPNRPAKKLYSLTAAGREALDAWLTRQPAIPNLKDDLLVQLYCLERVPAGAMVRHLERRRDDFLAEAQTLRGLLMKVPRMEAAAVGQVLALEASLARADGKVAWCEKALRVLQETGPQALPADREEPLPAASA
jgi:DNA-binding PadR family transcriptional regulator